MSAMSLSLELRDVVLGGGTGFVTSSAGYVMTAAHVVTAHSWTKSDGATVVDITTELHGRAATRVVASILHRDE